MEIRGRLIDWFEGFQIAEVDAIDIPEFLKLYRQGFYFDGRTEDDVDIARTQFVTDGEATFFEIIMEERHVNN